MMARWRSGDGHQWTTFGPRMAHRWDPSASQYRTLHYETYLSVASCLCQYKRIQIQTFSEQWQNSTIAVCVSVSTIAEWSKFKNEQGREKCLFRKKLLHYPVSRCEWLVRLKKARCPLGLEKITFWLIFQNPRISTMFSSPS